MDTVIVIRLGRLGDVTLTSPTMKNLRFLYPDSKILLVTRKAYRDLARQIPGISDVLTFPDNGSYFDLVRLSSDIDGYDPSLVVDLHKNFRSFHLAKLSRAKYKVVYKKRRRERQAAVSDKKFISPVPHTCDLYNIIIDTLKGERLARRPDLTLPESVLSGAGAERNAVAVVPGASSKVKAWSTDRFADVAERIVYDYKLAIHLFLGQEDIDLKHRFAHLPPDMVFMHCSLPLVEIIPLLARCRLTLTNDSGLMHVSAAVGTPTAALFGPTHEQLGFYPLGLFDRMIATEETCRPCSLHGNKACYREEQYCFTRISADEVYGEAADMLDSLPLTPAVFIDRDGTLIEDRHYLADPEGIEFIPGSLEAVASLKKAGYRIVVISNQSGVARGFFPVSVVDRVNDRLRELMKEADCEPDDIRYCPHLPDGDDPAYTCQCECRKPRAGMLEEAALKLGLDLRRSFIIGDKYSDIQCGRVAGGWPILVRTGEGKATESELPANVYLRPYHLCDNLAAAAAHILSLK